VQKGDSAIKYAGQASQYEYELAAISKKIYCYNTLMQFSNSKKEIRDIEEKLVKYKPFITEAVYNSNLQKRFEYEGAMFYAEGNYDQALSTYARLISINKGINSYEALMRNADYFAFIGRVNNEQGKPAQWTGQPFTCRKDITGKQRHIKLGKGSERHRTQLL